MVVVDHGGKENGREGGVVAPRRCNLNNTSTERPAPNTDRIAKCAPDRGCTGSIRQYKGTREVVPAAECTCARVKRGTAKEGPQLVQFGVTPTQAKGEASKAFFFEKAFPPSDPAQGPLFGPSQREIGTQTSRRMDSHDFRG